LNSFYNPFLYQQFQDPLNSISYSFLASFYVSKTSNQMIPLFYPTRSTLWSFFLKSSVPVSKISWPNVCLKWSPLYIYLTSWANDFFIHSFLVTTTHNPFHYQRLHDIIIPLFFSLSTTSWTMQCFRSWINNSISHVSYIVSTNAWTHDSFIVSTTAWPHDSFIVSTTAWSHDSFLATELLEPLIPFL
jgi:hypothetical protein